MMKIKKIPFLLIILLVGGGCSSKPKDIFKKSKSEDLVKSFDLEGLKKFQEKKNKIKKKVSTRPDQKIKEDKKEVVKKINTKVNVPTKKKSEKEETGTSFIKVIPPFVNPAPKKKKKNVKLKKVVKEKDGYPGDYPERLKEYDKNSIPIWKQFKPHFGPGEEYVLSLSYFGITAGHIKISTLPFVDIAGKKAFHFFARLKSASFYSSIYSLDDTIESFISVDEFLPIKYKLVQRESAQDVDDLQIFDLENFRTYHWYKRIKRGKKKNVEKNEFIPNYFQDSFSALFFVRGLPLNIGDKFEFPIVTRGKIWILKVHVAGEDEVDYDGEDTPALRLVAETHFPGVLKKKGNITFWYSKDSYRRLLKFEAKVKIGTLTGEMLEYKPGKL